MRAWNKRGRPKHWTKPKWHKRIFIFKTFYILKTDFMKEKINIYRLKWLEYKVINICLFNKIREEFKNGLEM